MPQRYWISTIQGRPRSNGGRKDVVGSHSCGMTVYDVERLTVKDREQYSGIGRGLGL